MIDNETSQRLKDMIDSIERLENEKFSICEDIKCIYQNARDQGFDAKVMKQLVKIRKMDDAEYEEKEMVLHTYMNALGMIDGGE